MEREYPDSNHNQGASVTPLDEVIAGQLRSILLAMGFAAGLLLLIAAINAAGLIVLHSDRRRGEVAIRIALGASTTRLMGQFAAEALLLALVGVGLGVTAAYAGIQLLKQLVSAPLLLNMPFLADLGLDRRMLAAAGLIALVAGLMLALVPAWQNAGTDPGRGLAFGRGASGTVWRKLGAKLVVAELATAIVLLAGAGLAGKSLYRLLHVNLGIIPEHLVTAVVNEPGAAYNTKVKQIAAADRIAEQIRALPGVQSVGVETNGLPLDGNGNTTWFHVAGRLWPGEHFEVPFRPVSEDYLDTLGAHLLSGRRFTPADDDTHPRVAIVNRAFAATYFPGQVAINKVLLTNSTPSNAIQVVGVVNNLREGPLDQDIPPVMYRPLRQDPDNDIGLAVRSAGSAGGNGDEASLLPAIEAAIRRVDPGIVVRDAGAMTVRIADSQSAYLHRSLAWLLAAFALMALLLSVVGLYGVVAYSVSQRRCEIGIRMALGARAGTIYRLILGEAGTLVTIGAAVGIACAIAAARAMSRLWFGVQAWDWTTLVAVALVLAAAALTACLRPAHTATQVNPADCMRAE